MKTRKRKGGYQMAYPYTGKTIHPPLAYTTKHGGNKQSSYAYPILNQPPYVRGVPIFPSKGGKKQKGGGIMSTYPNGLYGSAYNINGGLPGQLGSSQGTHYPFNSYQNDIQMKVQNIGAQPPFLGKAIKTGGRKKNSKRKKGGGLTNFFGQDFINVTRMIPYEAKTIFNRFQGISTPTNPLPTEGQLVKKM